MSSILSRSSFLTLSTLAVLLFPPQLLTSATYVVDQQKGSDSNAGDPSAPLKNIGAATAKLKAGDIILIENGVYRETVTIPVLGTAAAPIVVRAADNAKPVISGADDIKGWTACATAAEASGNPDFAKIYHADIDWKPTALFENGKKQEISQTPNGGWWPAPNTTSLVLTDEARLKGSDLVPEGATIFFFKYKGFAFARRPVQSFDPATGAITVSEPLGKDQFVANTDRYRLENHVRYIDQPGEWAFREKDGKFRVYYMPHQAKIAETLVEIPRRDVIFNLSQTAFCTVEGLAMTQAANPGRVPIAAVGNDVNKQIAGAGENITIRFCKIFYNGRYAIFGRGYKNLVIEKNLIHHNEYGVALAGQTNTRVESNEIAYNLVDGLIISHGSKDIVARNNYIHHHCQFGHPDNVQFYRGVDNILLEGNFLLASGQGVMMEEVEGVAFKNNVIAGTDANMIIMGHGNANNGEWERNTFGLWTSSIFALSGQNYRLKNNIMANSGGTLFYGIPKKGEFSSQDNLLFKYEGVKYKRLISKPKSEGEGNNWFESLESIQQAGEEEGSVSINPSFKNVPAYIYTLNPNKIGDCTRDKLFYDQKNAPDIAAGDIVEVHFDGLPRKVLASQDGLITIDPPLADMPDRVLFIGNWKQNSNFILDFSSPENSRFGATINTVNYQKGDFDGDGKRDVPEY